MKEVWKHINGYDKDYQISNFGRVKSFKYKEIRIIKQSPLPSGYLRVFLSKRAVVKTYYVHRLVAKIFISNPNKYPQCNHKDGNKLNNRINNLEWCSCGMNIQHAHDNGLIIYKNKTSKYKGVSWNKNNKAWVVTKKLNNKNIFGGYFKNEDNANKAYLKLIKKLNISQL